MDTPRRIYSLRVRETVLTAEYSAAHPVKDTFAMCSADHSGNDVANSSWLGVNDKLERFIYAGVLTFLRASLKVPGCLLDT